MKPISIRRTFGTVAALVALGAIAVSASACASAQGTAPVAPAQSAAPAPAPAAASASAPSTSAAAGSGQADSAVTTGKAVITASCIGKCHREGLLNKRYSQTKAQAIAADMGSNVGLSDTQKAAVAAYFAQ